jgi:hypothetical protein
MIKEKSEPSRPRRQRHRRHRGSAAGTLIFVVRDAVGVEA